MHLHRALHLDLEDNIIAGLQLFVHRSLQRAVVVINVLRVLEERIGGDLRLKVLFREEIILYAVLFTRTRRTGRRRDREEQLLVLAQQPGQHCALACTGRSGEYIQRSLTHLLVLLPRSRPQNEPQRSPAAEH